MIHQVVISKKTQKDLKKVPMHIVNKLMAWVESVETEGVENVRKVPGFHDEPLHGQRTGQRSIRLSKAYRAIYRIVADKIEFVLIEEVNKHDY